MAAITVTAANVLASSGATTQSCIAGATITAGQAVYLDTSTNTVKLASATAAATAIVLGIALNNASTGQPVLVAIADPSFTPGATLVLTAAADKGVYILGATAGAIHPITDAVATWIPTIIFVAKTAALATLLPVRGQTALS